VRYAALQRENGISLLTFAQQVRIYLTATAPAACTLTMAWNLAPVLSQNAADCSPIRPSDLVEGFSSGMMFFVS
jgi:hypothetical protein